MKSRRPITDRLARFHFLVPVLLAGALAGPARAQMPAPGLEFHPPPPLPDCAPAPLLYVRLMGAPSLKATFFVGPPPGRVFDIPFIVGLRPGYSYRLQLSGIPDYPEMSLYPTIEVIGTLQLPPKDGAAQHPATIPINEDDIRQVLGGAMITKVVYLEDPDIATPVATEPQQPLESDVPPNRDPLHEACSQGRPLIIFRMGHRQATPEELAAQTVPGTMLLPGDKFLAPAARKPWLPGAHAPEKKDECLRDGGDDGFPLGIGPGGKLGGLDPGDTAAEYTNACGERRVVTSNRCCLCVPRFIVLRGVIMPAGYEIAVGVNGQESIKELTQVQARLPSLETLQNEQLKAMHSRFKPSGNVGVRGPAQIEKVQVLNAYEMEIGVFSLVGTNELRLLKAEQIVRMMHQIELAWELSQPIGPRSVEQVEGPQVVGRVEGLTVLSSVQETRELAVLLLEPPCLPEKPLVLCKWIDRKDVHIGDEVTFYLKYSNHGGKPITEVAVSDSLTGRLEYVPDSARSDRDAVFTLQENEAGSVVLRWEIGGKVLPGQSGVVSFRARIR